MQWMTTFAVVAETGNIHRAASILCISPAAVSHHIRKLEQDVDTDLFYRRNNGMRLTCLGRNFLDTCLPVLEKVEMLRNFKKLEAKLGGIIRLTCINLMCQNIIDDMLEFKKLHPNVQFNIETASAAVVMRNIENGSYDLAATVYSELPGHLKFLGLRPSSAFLYTPPGNPFRLKEKPSWEEICNLPFIALTLEGYVNPVMPTSPELPQPENIVLAISDFMLVLRFVNAGLGVCLAPPLPPFQNPSDYSIFNVDHIFPIGTFGLITRRGRYLPPQVREFITFMQHRYVGASSNAPREQE